MSISARLVSTARTTAGGRAAWLLALAIGLGLLGGLLTVALSRLVSRIVNAVFLGGSPLNELTPFFIACLALVVLRALLAWAGEFSAQQAALRV